MRISDWSSDVCSSDLDVDDLQLRLVHAAVEGVEAHLLGQRGALAQRQQLQDAVFLAGQVQRMALHPVAPGIQVDGQIPVTYARVRMHAGAAYFRLAAGDQLALLEGVRTVAVGAAT